MTFRGPPAARLTARKRLLTILWQRFRSGPVIIAKEAKRCLDEVCFVRTVVRYLECRKMAHSGKRNAPPADVSEPLGRHFYRLGGAQQKSTSLTSTFDIKSATVLSTVVVRPSGLHQSIPGSIPR